MAVYIINGQSVEVVDLGFVDGQPRVYGVTHSRVVDLGFIDGNYTVYGVQVDDADGIVNLGFIDNEGDVYGVEYRFVPVRNYRRIQLDGGGRILIEACLGDEPVERYFELWRNGRPFPLQGVSNPVFSWRSPTSKTGEAVARIIDGRLGRIGVHLFEPNEMGTWKVQLAFVEEVNYDSPTDGVDQSPPYAPAPGAQEFWRRLPKALSCIVRNEGGW